MKLRPTPTSSVIASTLGCAGALGAAALMHRSGGGENAAVAAAVGIGVAVIAAVVAMVPFGGLTIMARLAGRRRFSRSPRLRNMLYAYSGIGMTWDHEAAAMYVAIKPRPFQVSVIDVPDQQLVPPVVPVDLIREHLHRSDIQPSQINIISLGFRGYVHSDFAQAYRDDVRSTPLPEVLNTIVEIKIDLGRSYQSILARATEGSIPTAVSRAAYLVAKRLEQQLNVDGWEVRLLRKRQIQEFHLAGLSTVNDGLQHEKWNYLPGSKGVHPVAFCRPTEWADRNVGRWYQVPADRMLTVVPLRPGRYGRSATAGMAVGFSKRDADTLPDKSLGLTRISGAQGDTATQILPLAQTVNPDALQEIAVSDTQPFPLSIPAAGLGLYLGPASGGGRTFLNVQTGGDILYVHAPEEFMLRLIARLAATGASVGVHLPAAHWATIAGVLAPGQIVTGEAARRTRRLVEIHPEQNRSRPSLDTAMIVWCPDELPDHVAYHLTARPDGSGHIHTPSGASDFRWRLETETLWLQENHLLGVAPAPTQRYAPSDQVGAAQMR